MYVTLRWEAIILLCENLQFGSPLHLLYGNYDYDDDYVYGDDVH